MSFLPTSQYYDTIAKGYKELYHEEQKKKINLVKEYFPKESIILDAGSGDGVLNEFIDKSNTLFSVDISEELLKLNSNFEKNKICSSIESLEFKDNYFDCICSFTVLQDCNKPTKALEELKRVCKKEGTIIVSFLKVSTKRKEIESWINTNLKVLDQKEEEKDVIVVCKKG